MTEKGGARNFCLVDEGKSGSAVVHLKEQLKGDEVWF
jgi:hypothetical protein